MGRLGMGISAEISLATLSGYKPHAKIAFTAFNNNLHAGTLKRREQQELISALQEACV